jgi:uncharacterized phage protein (TIGR01671 family)
MRRELKFRGWDAEEGKMYYFNLHTYMTFNEMAQEELCSIDAKDNLMQFTGLKDKSGKEIYIGDIVEIIGETTEGFYRTDRFEVVINDFSQIPVIDSHRGQEVLHKAHNICTVVGNVFDMPDWEF